MANGTDARLTTHVLDTSLGKPAAGIPVTLVKLTHETRRTVATAVTNADGRCDAPLMAGKDFDTGDYELSFEAGAYFERTERSDEEPRFLSDIVIRFGISERRHYHVPLLLSPFGYSTYRGS